MSETTDVTDDARTAPMDASPAGSYAGPSPAAASAALRGPAPASGGNAARLARWLSGDLSRPLAFTLLAIAYILSRAPWIDNGYGTKPDAWRIALSGYWLWDHHAFYPSRLPGYPVPELSYATIIKGGWLATNSLTVLVSLLGVWFFARIVREVEVPNAALIVTAYAFTPLLWINTMNTMDYTWALTFTLGCYYFLLLDNDLAAGIMLGLAVGSRLPSAAMLLPFGLYMWRSGKRDEIRTFVVAVVGVALLAFSPIIWRYGPRFLNFYDAKVGYREVIRLLAKDSLGLAGALALAIATVVSLPRLAKLPVDFVRDKNVMVWVIAIVLTAITFSRLPHEAAYLIPLFPFAYLVLGKYYQRWALLGAAAVIVLAGFVDLTTTNHKVALRSFRDLRVGQGMLLSNRDTQHAQFRFTRAIENLQVPDNSVVIIGFVYPQFAVSNRDRLQLGIMEKDKAAISQLSDKGIAFDPVHHVSYVWLLTWDDFEKYRRQGVKFFYTVDADRSTQALYGYRPGLFGAKLIDLGRAPSGEPDTNRTQR
ncbi:MAG: glycosyltransferase family protein [Dehalococcoidia bacterium]